MTERLRIFVDFTTNNLDIQDPQIEEIWKLNSPITTAFFIVDTSNYTTAGGVATTATVLLAAALCVRARSNL